MKNKFNKIKKGYLQKIEIVSNLTPDIHLKDHRFSVHLETNIKYSGITLCLMLIHNQM